MKVKPEKTKKETILTVSKQASICVWVCGKKKKKSASE